MFSSYCNVSGVDYYIEVDDINQVYLEYNDTQNTRTKIGDATSFEALMDCLKKIASIVVENANCFSGNNEAAIDNLSSLMQKRMADVQILRLILDN